MNPYPTRIGEHLMQTKQGLGRCPYLANLSMYIHCLMWPGAKGLTWSNQLHKKGFNWNIYFMTGVLMMDPAVWRQTSQGAMIYIESIKVQCMQVFPRDALADSSNLFS